MTLPCLSRLVDWRLMAGCDAGPGSGTGHRQGEHPPGDKNLGGQRKRDRDPLPHAAVRPGNPDAKTTGAKALASARI
jgi:hypothetical protein